MTTRSINQIVLSIKANDARIQRDIDDLAALFKGKAWATIRAALVPAVGKAYKVAVVDGKGKAQGTQVFDSEAQYYEAAKRCLSRLLGALTDGAPKPKTSSPRINVPRELRNSLVDQIIAAGLDKNQFNALLAQLRDSVSFK